MDMRETIIAKSDQLNADDLIAGAITVTISAVNVKKGAKEQPVAISFNGDGGRPYKPCKSMCRVLVAAWGDSSAAYVGRSMRIFLDPDVMFGGQKVGGIRISHLSHIARELALPLNKSRGKKALYTVKPLNLTPLEKACLTAAEKGGESLKSFWMGLSKEDQRAVSAFKDSCKVLAERADKKSSEEPKPELEEETPPPADIYARDQDAPGDADPVPEGERLLIAVNTLRDLGDADGANKLIAENDDLLVRLENVEAMELINKILGE